MSKWKLICAHIAVYSQFIVMIAYGYVLVTVWKAVFGKPSFTLAIIFLALAGFHLYCFSQYEKWAKTKE